MTQLQDSPPTRRYRRKSGDEVVPVPDGYVVYDDVRGMVHYLNPTAAIVLELCDLCATEAAIAGRIQAMFELSAPPDAEVDICLARLLEQDLILRN